MKYRVELDIAFDDKKDAINLLNAVEDIKATIYKPLGIEKITCYRKCRYHECNHEELNPTACKDYVNIDFDDVKKIHTLT